MRQLGFSFFKIKPFYKNPVLTHRTFNSFLASA